MTSEPSSHLRSERHEPIYDELAATPEFAELRRLYRGFVLPATVGFLSWYLLYILMSNYAGGFMNHRLAGNINVALVFGLLQFATTFGLAFLYSRFSATKLDPLARQLNDRFEEGRS